MRQLAAVLFFSLAPFTPVSALAQIGELDPAFSGDGRLTYAPVGDFADAFAAREDASGRVVVVGNSREPVGNTVNTDYMIVRVLANGTIDLDFGDGGQKRVGFDLEGGGFDYADAVWVRPDGRILVHGLAENDPIDGIRRTPGLVQLDTSGQLDSSFSGDGKLVLLFPDQGYVAGSSASALLPAGGDSIWVTGACYECTPDGRVRLALARVLGNGTHDLSFGVNGWLLIEPPAPITPGDWFFADWVRTADGKLWVAVGNYTGVSGLLRLTPEGVPDNTWGTAGWIVTDHGLLGSSEGLDLARAFAVDDRGRPILAWQVDLGTANEYVQLYRWTTSGLLDATFGAAGGVTLALGGRLTVNGVVPQGRRLLVVGSAETDFQNGAFDFFVARYQENGQLDPEFSGNGKTLVAFDVPGSTTHDFAMDLALVSGRPVLVGTAWEHALDLGAEPEGTTTGTRWAFARLQEDWIFADGFDQGGALRWSAVSP